jgi:hypothetical protein|tara:strand:+ start:3616 stop:4062 length:447 start_codon:yes stop_codon:yes gene_type:complete
MTTTPLSDKDLVISVNELAWSFLSHLGRNYLGTAPLHSLVDEDPRVRTAFDLACHAFEICRGSDIESALAEAGDEVLTMDYSNVAKVHGVVVEPQANPIISAMLEHISVCHGQLSEVSDNIKSGSVTQTEILNVLSNAQRSLDKAMGE